MNDLNLTPSILEIKRQISEIKRRHEEELRPYTESLESLRRVNTACENCFGTGRVFKRECAEDEGMERPCKECGGTGNQDKNKWGVKYGKL